MRSGKGLLQLLQLVTGEGRPVSPLLSLRGELVEISAVAVVVRGIAAADGIEVALFSDRIDHESLCIDDRRRVDLSRIVVRLAVLGYSHAYRCRAKVTLRAGIYLVYLQDRCYVRFRRVEVCNERVRLLRSLRVAWGENRKGVAPISFCLVGNWMHPLKCARETGGTIPNRRERRSHSAG